MSGQISTENSAAPRGFIPSHGTGRLITWEKGKSGNPGGLGGLYAEARKLAASKTLDAMQGIINLMDCDDPRVAFMACQTVLERAIGKPRDHSAEESAKSQVDLSALSDDERASLAMMLSKVLGFKAP